MGFQKEITNKIKSKSRISPDKQINIKQDCPTKPQSKIIYIGCLFEGIKI
jgi:hypothetical protein